MANEIAWQIEVIPDIDNVFMRAHRTHFRDGALQPGVFRQHNDGMSVNWKKYATALDTRNGATKNPNENAVVNICAGRIREIPGLQVVHAPDMTRNNRAHSNVLGIPNRNTPELVEVRLKLLRISTVVLPVDR